MRSTLDCKNTSHLRSGSVAHLRHKLPLYICLTSALWLSRVLHWLLHVLLGFNAGVANYPQETYRVCTRDDAKVCVLNFNDLFFVRRFVGGWT
jgi:hypothetical protein